MATIRRRDTASGPRWDVETRMPDRSKRSRTFTTEREAKAFAAQLLTARSAGDIVDLRRGRVPLSAVYQSWMGTRVGMSAKVRRGDEDNWRQHVEPAFGSWPVSRIDRESIQQWVNLMTDVSPRTVRWRHTLLRQVLQHAVDEGVIVRNPAARTAFPAMVKPGHTYLTPAEVEDLSQRCGPQGDIVTILAYTGLRWGELMGLNVGDLDLNRRRLYVRRSVTQVGGHLVEGSPKSSAGRRTVPLPPSLIPILGTRIEGRPRADAAIQSPHCGRIRSENWRRAVQWRTQTTAIGHPDCRIHDLRHTFASLARAAGADLRLLQTVMGHASVTVTGMTYADLFDGENDAVGDALENLMTSAEAWRFGRMTAGYDKESDNNRGTGE